MNGSTPSAQLSHEHKYEYEHEYEHDYEHELFSTMPDIWNNIVEIALGLQSMDLKLL